MVAAELGLPRPAAYPALALGTTEVTPLQIAGAYAAFANGGDAVTPTLIRRVVDSNTGEILVNDTPKTKQVIKTTTAYLITDMLSDVIKRGTARRANGSFKNVAIAGKTGTSRDGWFVGYTPNLVCAVWIGFDDNKQLGLTGAEAALPAWVDFMKAALAIRPSLGGANFKRPSGITIVKVDPETGWLAGPNCPSSIVVNVPYSFAPAVECLKHASVDYEVYEAEASDFDQRNNHREFDSSNADRLDRLETNGEQRDGSSGDQRSRPDSQGKSLSARISALDAEIKALLRDSEQDQSQVRIHRRPSH